MAAGMGSRYGGLKQLEHVSGHEQAIIDYSVYDAWVAGFETVIFVIRRELEEAFRSAIGDRISRVVEVKYAFQELDDLPPGYHVPEGRTKPWGTGQAVLAARHLVEGPFCVINADDYYGSEAFKLIHAVLSRPAADDGRLALSMVGYQLANTVTEHGSVSRGICELDENNHLLSITERTRIVADADGQTSFSEDGGETWAQVSPQSVVSMNIWGFPQAFMAELERRFPAYLDGVSEAHPNASEFFLPSVVGELIAEDSARVRVLRSSNKWYGITYPEDLPKVRAAIAEMTAARLYPEQLWI
ncbi:MAG: nucleotidyltransferase [Bacillota bacterium]|nr:nucleotidyltransferase [Bacillota bacterium]